MNPVKAYKLYVALKLHFTTDYDGFKYSFQVRTPDTAFYGRRDRYYFEKASQKYGEQLRRFYVTQFVDGVTYIRDMMSEEGHNRYLQRSSQIESSMYNLNGDLRKHLKSPREFFLGDTSTPPQVLALALSDSLHLETVAHLENTLGFLDKVVYKDPIVIDPLVMKVKKYAPFLRTETAKVKEIIDDIRGR